MANQDNEKDTDNSNRGFAGMEAEKQREIASQGGRAAHASGNAHEFTSEEAREACSRSHINDRGRSRDDDDDDDDDRRGGRGRGRGRSRDDDDDDDRRGGRGRGRGR
ncbi:KGG domain-containing protein, partial [Acinetobacter variabilis]